MGSVIRDDNLSRICQIYCDSLFVNFKHDKPFQADFKAKARHLRGASESKKLAVCASAFEQWCKSKRGSAALSVVENRCPRSITKEVLANAKESAVLHLLGFIR
jgi:hypothetical protein